MVFCMVPNFLFIYFKILLNIGFWFCFQWLITFLVGSNKHYNIGKQFIIWSWFHRIMHFINDLLETRWENLNFNFCWNVYISLGPPWNVVAYKYVGFSKLIFFIESRLLENQVKIDTGLPFLFSPIKPMSKVRFFFRQIQNAEYQLWI